MTSYVKKILIVVITFSFLLKTSEASIITLICEFLELILVIKGIIDYPED